MPSSRTSEQPKSPSCEARHRHSKQVSASVHSGSSMRFPVFLSVCVCVFVCACLPVCLCMRPTCTLPALIKMLSVFMSPCSTSAPWTKRTALHKSVQKRSLSEKHARLQRVAHSTNRAVSHRKQRCVRVCVDMQCMLYAAQCTLHCKAYPLWITLCWLPPSAKSNTKSARTPSLYSGVMATLARTPRSLFT